VLVVVEVTAAVRVNGWPGVIEVALAMSEVLLAACVIVSAPSVTTSV
jgi:hypothetical protein